MHREDLSNRRRLWIAGGIGLVVAGTMLAIFVSLIGGTVMQVRSADPVTAQQELPQELTPVPTTSEPPPTSATPSPTTRPSRTPQRQPTLTATPVQAAAYDRIDLSGSFPGLPAGTPLQVQRREGGSWVAFPVSLQTGAGGEFTTYVETGRLGANLFRVTATGSARSTATVTVQIG